MRVFLSTLSLNMILCRSAPCIAFPAESRRSNGSSVHSTLITEFRNLPASYFALNYDVFRIDLNLTSPSGPTIQRNALDANSKPIVNNEEKRVKRLTHQERT